MHKKNEGLLQSKYKKKTVFEVGQRVWVYTLRTKKGLSKKLMHNWLGIVEKLSLVHFKLRTITNKKVAFSGHANRMKPFVDPNLRPIDSPPFDDPAEPYINESGIPKDCFEIEMPLSPQPQNEKESNKESDQEKTKNQLQNP